MTPAEAAKQGLQDFILRVKYFLTPTEEVHNGCILCRDGIIQATGGYSALRVLDDIPCINFPNCHALPGLIDTHLHGSGGFAAMDADDPSADIAKVSKALVKHGVTAFVPTVLSASLEKMKSVVSALADFHERQDYSGAIPVGIHLEGPFLNTERCGAQSAQAIRPVNLKEAEILLQSGRGHICTMTLAPELDGSVELIRMLVSEKVVASMGHSMADEEHVLRAIDAGASRCTHLFNGMPPLSQRETGLTSVALTNDSLTIELIVDGVHVHPRMIDLACRAKPKANIVGISDATQGAALGDGFYHLGNDQVQVRDGVCRRVADGKLAGSCLTLDSALRNLKRFASLPEADTVTCFTRNAAESLGLNDRGQLQPGKRADITVMDDAGKVEMTIVGGHIAFYAGSES